MLGLLNLVMGIVGFAMQLAQMILEPPWLI